MIKKERKKTEAVLHPLIINTKKTYERIKRKKVQQPSVLIKQKKEAGKPRYSKVRLKNKIEQKHSATNDIKNI